MPTVSVVARDLFQRLGRPHTQEEVESLCFAFGVELDDVIEEEGQITFKIDVPANRYDLLCVEGLGRALAVFSAADPSQAVPSLKLLAPKTSMTVKASVSGVRPYIACAILRGVRLNASRLKSFVNLQEKLHHTVCRRRTLVSIGTYDMSSIHLPLTYEALPPESFRFHPLGCGDLPAMNGAEMLAHFSSHLQLKQYLHMLEGQPLLPVLLDAKRQVLSAPPLINADFCRLTEESRDVFIDCTAVDSGKAQLVLTTVAALFSEYCDAPFEIEAVEVAYEDAAGETVSKASTPSLEERSLPVQLDYLRRISGVQTLTVDEASVALQRLMLKAHPDPAAPASRLIVNIPPIRSDILHACDVAEDLAIGLGFSRLPITLAPILKTNKRTVLAQSVRACLASLGFNECLTFALCSAEENFTFLKRPTQTAASQSAATLNPLEYHSTLAPVLLGNAKSRELTETRVQLISGVLKSLANNIGRKEMPIRLFEVGDVVCLDKSTEVGSRNLLYGCAAYADEHGSGLEEVHGVVDALFERLGCIGDYTVAERRLACAAASGGGSEGADPQIDVEKMRVFSLEETREATFLPGRQVRVVCEERPRGEQSGESANCSKLVVGSLGTLHADVLRSFGLSVPVSVVEFTLEPFVKWLSEVDLIFA